MKPPAPRQYEEQWRLKAGTIAQNAAKWALTLSILAILATQAGSVILGFLMTEPSLAMSTKPEDINLMINLIHWRRSLMIVTALSMATGTLMTIPAVTPHGKKWVRELGARIGAWFGKWMDAAAHRSYIRAKRAEWKKTLSTAAKPVSSASSTNDGSAEDEPSAEERFKL